MSRSKSATLPLLPLLRGSVLLPGTTLRIPVSHRPDVPPLLTSAYTQARASRGDATSISLGCVPLNLPLLSSEGQNLIGGPDVGTLEEVEDLRKQSGEVEKEHLFKYGTVAKISGIQGSRSDLVLIVEGVRRFKINKITQERPFFEAKVTYLDEESM